MMLLSGPLYSEDRISIDDLLMDQRDINKYQTNQKTTPVSKTHTRVTQKTTKEIDFISPKSVWVESSGEIEKETDLIPAQTKILCKLNTDTMSSYKGFSVTGQVLQDVGKSKLKGSLIVGKIKGVSASKKRVFIDFNSIVTQSGKEHSITSYAIDQVDNHPGLKAQVDGKEGLVFLKILGETATSVLSIATELDASGFSGDIVDATSGSVLDSLDTEKEFLVEEGTYFYLVFQKPAFLEKDG